MPFLEAIYGAGWPNGWREYDMESLAQLQGTLQSVGADTAAFLPFMEGGGAGDEALRASNEAAEAAGAVGCAALCVPPGEWAAARPVRTGAPRAAAPEAARRGAREDRRRLAASVPHVVTGHVAEGRITFHPTWADKNKKLEDRTMCMCGTSDIANSDREN